MGKIRVAKVSHTKMEELQRRIVQLEREVEILKGRSLPSKKRIFLRPHTVVATLVADSSEMVLEQFRKKVKPEQWTRDPHYEMNVKRTCVHVYCGSRCGSRRKKKSIYAVSLKTGVVVKFTDVSQNTGHGPKCIQ